MTYTPKHEPGEQTGSDGLRYDWQALVIMEAILRTDSNCVDVGAYQGAYLQRMLRIAPFGRHFAFEPLVSFYETLQKRFSLSPLVSVYNCALTDDPGTSTFQYVESNPAYSGLRKRRYERDDEVIREIFVRTATLDQILPEGVPIDFMKIDVEGAELQVLRGAVKTLRKYRPTIVFEHGLGGADHYGTDPQDVYSLLVDDCRLQIFLMQDWLNSAGRLYLDRPAFCDEFWSHRNYNFMAC